MMKSENNILPELTNDIVEKLRDETEKVEIWLARGHANDVELGKYLESAWGKLEGTENRGRLFRAWTEKTMGHKKTKAGDARKLYNLCEEYKDELEKVGPEYLATIKTSQLRYALSKLKAQKMTKNGSWNKDINLKDIDFQYESMRLSFHHTQEIYDLRDLTFAKLKSLVDPNYAPPIDRNSLEGLREREEKLMEQLGAIRDRISELDSPSAAA